MNCDTAKTLKIQPSLDLKTPFNNLLGMLAKHPHNLASEMPSSLLAVHPQHFPMKENLIHIPSFLNPNTEDLQNVTPTTASPRLDSIKLSCFRQIAHAERIFEAHNFLKKQKETDIIDSTNFDYLNSYKNTLQGTEKLGVLPLSQNSKKISRHVSLLTENQQSKESAKNVSEKRRFHKKLRSRRNPWKPEEDTKLLELIGVYGESWAMISSKMKDRTGKQIRDRFLNILRPNLKRGEWQLNEDDILIALHAKFGHKWSLIAKHMPGRSEAQVKNRFYSSVRKKISEGKYDGVIDSSEFMNKANETEDIEEEESVESTKESEDEHRLLTRKMEETAEIQVKLENWEPKQELESIKKEVDEEIPSEALRSKTLNRAQHFNSLVNSDMFPSSRKPVLLIPQLSHKISEEHLLKRQIGMEQEKTETESICGLNHIGRSPNIKEKEVDLVLEILARYYEKNRSSNQEDTSESDDGFKSMEEESIKKDERKKQLSSRMMNLEFLLVHTMQEMEKLSQKRQSKE